MTTGEQTRAAKSGAVAEGRRSLNLRGLLQVLIGVGAFALVFVKSDPRGLLEAAHAMRAGYLAVAVVTALGVVGLMALRWGVILRVRHRVSFQLLFLYYLIATFFTNFVPGGGVSGDVARLILVDREVRDKSFTLSTLLYERLVAGFTLLLVGVAAGLTSRADTQMVRVIYASAAALGVLFAVACVLLSDFVSSRFVSLVKWAGVRLRLERAGNALGRTLEALRDFRRYKRMLAITFLLSILIRMVWSLGCYAVAAGMNLPLSLPTVFAFISIVDLIRLLPISIGGVGVREWALVVLFANVGLAREQALMYSLFAFAPLFLLSVAGGLFYVSRASIVRAGSTTVDAGARARI